MPSHPVVLPARCQPRLCASATLLGATLLSCTALLLSALATLSAVTIAAEATSRGELHLAPIADSISSLSQVDQQWIALRPNRLMGRVVGIADGDTLTLLVGADQLRIRLQGIDAPEGGQAFGAKSRQALADLTFGKDVAVVDFGQDDYGRTLGAVLVGSIDVNATMVRSGFAWHYRQYSDDPTVAQYEQEARSQKRGLWADSNALAPWEYRARQSAAPERVTEVSGVTKVAQAAEPDLRPQEASVASHWLNTSSQVRHNRSCTYFENTKRGRYCSSTDGRACGRCGG